MPSVAVVDDDPDACETLVRIFEDHGYSAYGVADGQAALRLLGGVKCDLLVTDFQMPGMDGEDLVRAVRAALPDASRMPVIILSGRDRDAWSDTNVIFVGKPPDIHSLISLANKLVEKTPR
jgi:CheY-like chemotaxis protein